ncbi:MAG: hypothetical protein Wins2KO_22300 [Winogradskyella sp.]
MNVFEIEHRLVPVIARMENNGVKINMPLLDKTKLRLTQMASDIETDIQSHLGNEVNINSNEQLSEALFNDLRIQPKSEELTKKGSYKVNKAHLIKLVDQHDVIAVILRHRKVKSLYKFCNQLDKSHKKTNRLHCNFNQIGTETGRCSSSKPNLQNIPNPKLNENETDELKLIEAQYRKMFIPKRGWVYVCADYSQMELRVMAHFSQDPFLVKAFNEDEDIHELTASEIFGVKRSEVTDEQRSIAKSINFGLIYGKTAYGLADDLTRITKEDYSVEMAQRVIDDYFEKLPAVKQCLDAFIDQADDLGYSQTLYGRKRPIPQLSSNNSSKRNAGKRIAMNTPIQGTAADILKIAMIKCDKAISSRGLKSKMILTVHDELLFEVPENEEDIMVELVRENMENAAVLSVPLKVDLHTGTNWAEVH